MKKLNLLLLVAVCASSCDKDAPLTELLMKQQQQQQLERSQDSLHITLKGINDGFHFQREVYSDGSYAGSDWSEGQIPGGSDVYSVIDSAKDGQISIAYTKAIERISGDTTFASGEWSLYLGEGCYSPSRYVSGSGTFTYTLIQSREDYDPKLADFPPQYTDVQFVGAMKLAE